MEVTEGEVERVERAFRTLKTADLQVPPIHHRLAKRQNATRRGADGTPPHSFRTLLEDLATVTRNRCHTRGRTDTRQTEFELDTQLSAQQARVLELLRGIRV